MLNTTHHSYVPLLPIRYARRFGKFNLLISNINSIIFFSFGVKSEFKNILVEQ